MNIVVTGGAGYIGSQTCKTLAELGYNPVVFDNFSTGHKDFVRWGEFVEGDLHETQKLINVFSAFRPLAVIHFAASAYVGESVRDPLKYYENNVSGTISLLKAMRHKGLRSLVFSSTCATYGSTDSNPITELTPQNPINPYGRSKLVVEHILSDLNANNELNFVSLRYFNAAGADPDCELGERHDPETHLIPLAISSAMGGKELKIFGADFPTYDGTPIRDYVHVQDLARGHVRALDYLLKNGGGHFFNLGVGRGVSVLEILDALKELGLRPKFKFAACREGDPAVLVADIAKAKKILGWKPVYCDVRDLLETAIAWHEKDLKIR